MLTVLNYRCENATEIKNIFQHFSVPTLYSNDHHIAAAVRNSHWSSHECSHIAEQLVPYFTQLTVDPVNFRHIDYSWILGQNAQIYSVLGEIAKWKETSPNNNRNRKPCENEETPKRNRWFMKSRKISKGRLPVIKLDRILAFWEWFFFDYQKTCSHSHSLWANACPFLLSAISIFQVLHETDSM